MKLCDLNGQEIIVDCCAEQLRYSTFNCFCICFKFGGINVDLNLVYRSKERGSHFVFSLNAYF
jgi:hypothetical protein